MQNKKLSLSQELAQKYMMNFINRIPVTFVRGQGLHLWDEEGKEYLDFVGGWAVDSLGHCHPVLSQALAEAGSDLIHVFPNATIYRTDWGSWPSCWCKNSCLGQSSFLC